MTRIRKQTKNSTVGKKAQRGMSVLEKGTLAELNQKKEFNTNLQEYHWHLYAELARQRNEIREDITKILISTSVPYEIKKFQRAVKYKYALKPLSAAGSKRGIGGRFNIGADLNPELSSFPGLYLGEDKKTVLQEHLAQSPTGKRGLTSEEISLTNPNSTAIVSVSGAFDKIFDLTKSKNLSRFIQLFEGFSFSKELLSLCKKLNLPDPRLIATNVALKKELLKADWRREPMLYDIPSNSQIFGHLVYSSGVEGIIYLSKFTKKSCIVVFHKNFTNTGSFIELDDEPPTEETVRKIDAINCSSFE